eukprot:CAMPEP_0201928754 /NCGR_PEP_ID=MMETSP0903-20130614/21647_1 /ASSEMBLY_ACC=CAM_ASM_000552 /TAXON_ID=420261 /ORGANISM="Thalassiosira antarctica, Strain CCMP982" /LENGTH=66 /DNA_ID=CAMNT_0048467331 /DNA_START=157 /DNA_END=358 /DNA_ORIENTATION=+
MTMTDILTTPITIIVDIVRVGGAASKQRMQMLGSMMKTQKKMAQTIRTAIRGSTTSSSVMLDADAI